MVLRNRTSLLQFDKAIFPLILLFSIASLRAQSSLHRVPQGYRSIQSAVNAAHPGDTVLVDEGLYYENLRINKNIVLGSRFIIDGDTSHISHTVLDGSRPLDSLKASVIRVEGQTDTNCVFIGLTIQHGAGTYSFIKFDHPADSTLPGASEHWIGGGGIMIRKGSCRIAHNIIRENTVSTRIHKNFSYGAGIASAYVGVGLEHVPPMIIELNLICNNTSSGEFSEGAGIDVGQPAIIRHNTVMENRTISRTRSAGGGLCVGFNANFDIIVDGNYIRRNSAGIAGGLLISGGFASRGRAIVTNNIITENRAFELGGAVNVVERSYAIFINNTIVCNKTLSHAGGINITAGAYATLVNNVLWGNDLDQVSIWGYMQAHDNLVQGGLPGRGNIDVEPAFLPDDSLYRLSPNSPGINTGAFALRLLDKPFPMPERDFSGTTRAIQSGNPPDMGATESPWSSSSSSERILSERKNSTDASTKLTVIFSQISGVERKPGTQEIIRAGQMRTTVIVNDSLRRSFEQTAPDLSFVLPPGKNLLELEVYTRARDTTRRLNVSYRLEGFESNASILPNWIRFAYHNYADLKPGTYRLTLQPQDDEDIIGPTNRVSFSIVVLPFWYQRWWAYVLYGLGVMTLAAAVFLVRIKRLRLEDQVRLNRLEARKLGELDRMKSRFFANLSHEFRTPLSLILGPADQLETTEPESGRKEQLGLIRRNAERLLRMVNLLLQFARIEAGTLKLQVTMQPIPYLVRRIVSSFSTACLKKGIALHADIEPAFFDGYIDAEKVEHVLENLLSNAVKYTPSGGRVDIRARRIGTELSLEVSDTGIGISPDHLSHVFERFYRVDASHRYEGTGIGLSLSKELVDMHHGTIELKSTLGQGTVASVRLPLSGYGEHEIVKAVRPSPEEGPLVPEQPHISQDISGKEVEDKTVVLVAEDNDDAREYIRSRLSPEFEVMGAVNGVQAWETAIQRVPDVVVTDVMMPEMSGYELCAKLKQDERTSHIPVVLLTALADQTDKIEGLQTGADDYLVKPFDAQELLVRVRNLIANRKVLQDKYRTSVPLKPGEVKVESLENKFLGKVMAVVESHISEEQFDVEQFAYQTHLSRGQLHRKLKALTNLSPTDFIRYFRLQRAKVLLEKRAGSVSEIAYQVGFTNHSYFAKCFKEQFGCLPSEVGRS